MKKQFRDFESAREFVRKLNLNTQREWFEYCKSDNKPDDLPRNVDTIYKNEFKGYGDWLGTGTVAPQNKVFCSFKEAREFVRKLGLKNDKDWREYCASGNKPDNIPSAPWGTYKNDFNTLGDFLGTENIALQNKQFRSFKEAREFVRKLGLKNDKDWREYCASGDRPDDIPAHPWDVYKEWKKK